MQGGNLHFKPLKATVAYLRIDDGSKLKVPLYFPEERGLKRRPNPGLPRKVDMFVPSGIAAGSPVVILKLLDLHSPPNPIKLEPVAFRAEGARIPSYPCALAQSPRAWVLR